MSTSQDSHSLQLAKAPSLHLYLLLAKKSSQLSYHQLLISPAPQTKMMTSPKVWRHHMSWEEERMKKFTREEVSRHAEDFWVIIDGLVFDLSSFAGLKNSLWMRRMQGFIIFDRCMSRRPSRWHDRPRSRRWKRFFCLLSHSFSFSLSPPFISSLEFWYDISHIIFMRFLNNFFPPFHSQYARAYIRAYLHPHPHTHISRRRDRRLLRTSPQWRFGEVPTPLHRIGGWRQPLFVLPDSRSSELALSLSLSLSQSQSLSLSLFVSPFTSLTDHRLPTPLLSSPGWNVRDSVRWERWPPRRMDVSIPHWISY